MTETLGTNYLREFLPNIMSKIIEGATDPDIADLAIRGEQPDSPALPADGALRGDVPLSGTERSEV